MLFILEQEKEKMWHSSYSKQTCGKRHGRGSKWQTADVYPFEMQKKMLLVHNKLDPNKCKIYSSNKYLVTILTIALNAATWNTYYKQELDNSLYWNPKKKCGKILSSTAIKASSEINSSKQRPLKTVSNMKGIISSMNETWRVSPPLPMRWSNIFKIGWRNWSNAVESTFFKLLIACMWRAAPCQRC